MTQQPSRVRPLRRPDESMALINDLFAKSIDPEYAEAAARRKTEPAAPRSKTRPVLLVGLLALGLLLSVAVDEVRDSEEGVSAEREGLIDRIDAEDTHIAQLEDQIASLEAENSDLEQEHLQDSATGQQLREQVEELQAQAGTMAVTGPGVVVHLDNAPDYENAENPALAQVLDLDLLQVVNGLWAAGAEAISINGQRITPSTAIRSANNVIKINYRPMDAPFEVEAVGDSRSLATEFGEGSGGQWLRLASQQTGLQFSISTEESLTIPAGNVPLLFARPEGAS